MTDFINSLPEDAKKLIQPKLVLERCTCQWDWLADPSDTEYLEFRRSYPRSYPVITFSATCSIAAHQAKAGTTYHFNHWKE